MKNKLTTHLHTLKKLLPRWSGGDVGHTAARDWYFALMLTSILGLVLIGLDVMRFGEARTLLSEKSDTLPVRGLPATEEQIYDVWELFVTRGEEFESYNASAPIAPLLDDTPSYEQVEVTESVVE